MEPLQFPVCMTCVPRRPLTANQSASSLWCELCGTHQPTAFLPFVLVTGASASGKSTQVPMLRQRLLSTARFVVLDTDLLLHLAEPDWQRWCNDWLLLAHGLAQNGQTLVLCGPVDPHGVERLPARALVSRVEVVLLDCADEARRSRLQDRPAWRGWSTDNIAGALALARDLRQRGYFSLDTSQLQPDTVASVVARRITDQCPPQV